MTTKTRCARGTIGTLGDGLHKCTGGRFCKGNCKPGRAGRQATEREDQQAKARRIVATGVCPDCGTALRRNTALTGWWQCGAYGEPDRRTEDNHSKPACSFQCFTE